MRIAKLASISFLFAIIFSTQVQASDSPESRFTVSDKTEIPGTTLGKGDYSIQILDRLSDRMILRVTKGASTKATFIGLPGTNIGQSTSAGPITWSTAGKHKGAMRGFSFTDGTVVEFVYPKAQAAALAKENGAKVAAIDPASEGRVEENLSHADMQMVTLWLLSPTTVGPNGTTPAIQAERYKAPEQQVASTHPAQTSDTTVAAHESSSRIDVASLQGDAVRMNARSTRVLSTLPHTAGPMPVIWLVGLMALCGLGAIKIRRTCQQ